MESSGEQDMPRRGSNEHLDLYIQEIFRLMKNYEALVNEIQIDAKRIDDDNQKLRRIISDENVTTSEKQPQESFESFRNDYVEVADKIFYNLRIQNQNLAKEKELYETLWRNTAAVLEKEVPIQSFTQMEAKYTSEMKAMGKDLLETKRKFDIQTKAFRLLQQEQVALVKQNKALAEKLKETTQEKEEAEQCFKEAAALNKEQLEQSTTSFNKLCEATTVADESLAEIELLRKEKREMEQEINNLAETIGSVINTASSKVENMMEELKQKHKSERDDLLKEIDRLNQMNKQRDVSDNSQASEFQRKIDSIEQANTALTENLRSTLNTIANSLELNQRTSSKSKDEEVKKLKKLIEYDRMSRRRLKELVVDIIKSLEQKVKQLLIENFRLKGSRAS